MTLKRCSLSVFGLVLMLGQPLLAAPDCGIDGAVFDRAVEERNLPRLLGLIKQAGSDPDCDGRILGGMRREVTDLLAKQAMPLLEADPPRLIEAEQWLDMAPGISWALVALRADIASHRQQWVEAAKQYGNAYEIASDPSLTPNATGERMRRMQLMLFNKGTRMWRLAAHDGEALQVGYIGRSGEGGGVLASRGPKPERFAVPVTFKTDQHVLDEQGRGLAERLAQYIWQQRPQRVFLYGHADPRGSEAHNLELSQNRAETIKAFVAARFAKWSEQGADYRPEIEAIGLGKRCPPNAEERFKQNQVHWYALWRRVGLVLDETGTRALGTRQTCKG